MQGLKLTRKPCRNFATVFKNLVSISQILATKIVALHCVVSGLVKQNMKPQYLCVKKPLKMANDRINRVVHVPYSCNIAAKLRYNFSLSSD